MWYCGVDLDPGMVFLDLFHTSKDSFRFDLITCSKLFDIELGGRFS